MKTKPVFFTLVLMAAFALLSSCTKDQSFTTPALADEVVTDRASETTVYPLNSVMGSGVSGTATFRQIGSKTMITLELDGTEPGNSHPAHIHFNSVAVGGGIAVSLKPVNGASGRSVTIVSATDAGMALSYEDLLDFNGYINVHLSATQLSTVVAQGNIGSNF
jgi:hypothetical protein